MLFDSRVDANCRSFMTRSYPSWINLIRFLYESQRLHDREFCRRSSLPVPLSVS
jgi:hypothetical protein